MMIRNILYVLKRKFPSTVSYKQFISETMNRTTGKLIKTFQTTSVKCVVFSSKRMLQETALDRQIFSSVNDPNSRVIAIDNLAFEPSMKDTIDFDNQNWTIKSIKKIETAWVLTVSNTSLTDN